MRFLLHPRRSNVVKGATSYVLSKSSTAESVQPVSSVLVSVSNKSSTNAQVDDGCHVETRRDGGLSASSSSISSSATSHSRRRAWGQQCSPQCGCVVRFEADIRNNTIESATYHAKQLILTKSSGYQELQQPSLTTKGRPMLQTCNCKTLHHLSNAVLDHMVGKNVSRLKNSLEFHSTRSSTAFRHAVLQAQGLPVETGTKCFDLVEETLTAMLKGYLPKPRAPPLLVAEGHHSRGPSTDTPIPTSKKPLKRLQLPRHVWQANHGEDDEEAFPNMFWWSTHNDGSEAGHYRSTSTLRMFDLEHERIAAATRTQWKNQQRRRIPRDWVSYVDELNRREESSA